MTGRSKAEWSKEAKARAFERLKETQKKPPSYHRKKLLLEQIKDDLPRY